MLLSRQNGRHETYQHFVVRHSVGAQAVAVEGDAVCCGAGVHGVDLPREQAVVSPPQSGWLKNTQAVAINGHA